MKLSLMRMFMRVFVFLASAFVLVVVSQLAFDSVDRPPEEESGVADKFAGGAENTRLEIDESPQGDSTDAGNTSVETGGHNPYTGSGMAAIERRFHEALNGSGDLSGLAADALQLSEEGDSAASLVVYEIQSFCQSTFERFPTRQSLEENLLEANHHRPAIRELMREEFAMCDRVPDVKGFPTDARPRLLEAARNHHPAALVELIIVSETSRPLPGSDDDPMAKLTKEALDTMRPDVLWKMQHVDLPIELDTSQYEERTRNRLEVSAWRLLACEEGYPCSPEARWVRLGCAYAETGCRRGSGGRDYLRDLLGPTRFEQAEDLAARIRKAISGRNWSKLGL